MRFSVATALALSALSIGAASVADARRGGTLRVDYRSDFDFIDPALAYFSHSWQGNFMTQCKLLSFPDRDAPQGGLKIIPEVARSRPTISANGRTYTFRLRTSYQFSNGDPVKASNFELAFERVASRQMQSPFFFYMKDIAGARAFHAGRADDIKGIDVLGPNRIRFQLTKPNGDFPARLTMPAFGAVPDGTPIDPAGADPPFDSCGAYTFQEWDKGRTAVLVRNRFYRGPRPANPDRIVYNFGLSYDEQRQRCESGDSDICFFPPTGTADLRERYGVNRGRFFVKGQAVFWYLNFNHDEPLFRGNNRLKQAVNHALDRPEIVEQSGAVGARRTDQILPIDFPGFRNWNLYSLRGASLTKARRLARGSRRSGNVRLWTFESGFGPSVAQVVKFNLKQIGLDTEITTLDRVVQTTRAGNRDTNEYDMLLNGWGEDYPDPYDFINILLSGSSIQPDNNVNLSYFNERKWNRRMNRATRLFGAERLREYGDLDGQIMSGPAPIAPLFETRWGVLLSERVSGVQFNRRFGPILGTANIADGEQPDGEPPPPPTCEQPLTATRTIYFDQPHAQVFGNCANLLPAGLHHVRIDAPSGKPIVAFAAHSQSCYPWDGATPQPFLNCHVKPDGRICVILDLEPEASAGDVLGASLRREDDSVMQSGNLMLPVGDQPACQTSG
jgi:ABC-type transport system substrate-binding protein